MEEITVLIPSYRRRKFLPLLLKNLKVQDYPHHLIKVIVDDDSPIESRLILSEELDDIKKHLHPIKFDYITPNKKRSIGFKRNNLVKLATTKIVTFIDDDDIYLPTYISYQYSLLKEHKAGCVGSNKMIFTSQENGWSVYALDCGDKKNLIHEACLMFSKKWYRASCGFENSSQGEGRNIFQGHEKNVIISDIIYCMICIQHQENTIDKRQFCRDETKIDIVMNDNLIEILDKILKN